MAPLLGTTTPTPDDFRALAARLGVGRLGLSAVWNGVQTRTEWTFKAWETALVK